MDRLMESHRGTQAHLVNSQDYEENSQELMTFLQERLHSARISQKDGRDAIEEEDEDNADEHEEEHEHEDESLISNPYHEAGDYSNFSSSCSYRDNEGGDDFDRVVSPSRQPYQSQSFYHSPIIIQWKWNSYDLRGHMEQLYHEMSELKKIIKGCMNMQMELQQTMKVEIKSGLQKRKATTAFAEGQPYMESGRVWYAKDIGIPSRACRWMNNGFMAINTTGAGKAFIRSIYELYASWGVDFVKLDCVFGEDLDLGEITYVSEILNGLNNSIVFSVSPGVSATPEMAEMVSGLVNMYRITKDDWDKWPAILSHFNVSRDFAASNLT